jgi:hypothetical protein
MTDNRLIISRGNVPRSCTIDEEVDFMNTNTYNKRRNVEGVRATADYDLGASPSKLPGGPTTSLLLLNEKAILQEKKVCYISNFDLSTKEWVAEFKGLDLYRQSLVNNLGKYHV